MEKCVKMSESVTHIIGRIYHFHPINKVLLFPLPLLAIFYHTPTPPPPHKALENGVAVLFTDILEKF